MCRGLIQWWQSRTVSAAPLAGWTSSAGEGSTTSAGPFSQWTQYDCPTSCPEKLWCPVIWMTQVKSSWVLLSFRYMCGHTVEWNVDFITDLAKSEGYTCILIALNRFFKACKIIPLWGLPTAIETAEALFHSLFRTFSIPEDDDEADK